MLPANIQTWSCLRLVLVLLCALILSLASACVPQPPLTRPVLTSGNPGGTRGVVYAYSVIRSYAFEDIAPGDLAEAGLRGLSEADAAFRVERTPVATKLFHGDKLVYEFASVSDGDFSTVIDAAVASAKAASPAYAKLFDVEQQVTVIKGMLSRVSAMARYVGPTRPRPAAPNLPDGFGATWIRAGEKLTVTGVADGSLAALAGVETGDSILSIDGRAVSAVDDAWINDRLTLPKWRPTILRMTRKNYNLGYRLEFNNRSQPMEVTWNDGIGVIRLSRIEVQAAGTMGPETLALRLQRLVNEHGVNKLKGLVLDLRGNKGGLLIDSANVADIFLPFGPIAVIHYRSAPDQVLAARDAREARSPFEQVPLVVLVDGFTSGGAELIAGAVQLRQRGVVIGNTTAGYASIDSVISLSRGNLAGAMLFPTGRVVLPGNQTLAGRGLAPTVCLADPDQPPDARVEAGSRRMAAFAHDARIVLSDAEWVSMHAVCPPDVNDSEGDAELAIADRIIRDGALYRRLLDSLPPNPTTPAENFNVPAR